GEIAVITGGNVHGNYSLPDVIKVDMNVDCPRSSGWWLWRRRFRGRGRFWRFIASLRQKRRRFVCIKHGEVNGTTNGPIDRTHLKPTGARPIVRARHEIEILAAGIEGGRVRIGESVRDLMALLFS